MDTSVIAPRVAGPQVSPTGSAAAGSIALQGVTKAYGRVVAVDAIDLTVEPGRLVTLLGPSGCGKTTTLRLIAGLELATSGRVLIGGEDVTALSASERDVGVVFQSYALFPHMSVLANVAYGLRMGGSRRRDAEARAQAMLESVGLQGLERRLPGELSGGQQQRVAVARALVVEPQVLLFDEPLSNLDARLRRQVREDIRELQQRLGLTVVYVTHDQEEALAVSDRIVVMHNARIAQEGAPQMLYEHPRTRFVAGFLGDTNLLPAQVVEFGHEVEVRLAGTPIERGRLVAGSEPQLAIRPEQIGLRAGAEGAAWPSGRVARAVYLGGRYEYWVETELGRVLVFESTRLPAHRAGDAVTLEMSPEAVSVLWA
jgi:iron(III) transport system ATP-binding protein